MTSQTDDDFVFTTGGMAWSRAYSKVIEVNLCTALFRGMAHYVAVWDVDEYFIPLSPSLTIQDVIDPMAASNDGMADGENHPYCYFHFQSHVLANDPTNFRAYYKPQWVGDNFAHMVERQGTHWADMGYVKSISPLDRIFQMGLHVPGACRIPDPARYTTCAELSNTSMCEGHFPAPGGKGMPTPPRPMHHIDEHVKLEDAKFSNPNTTAVVYHVMMQRSAAAQEFNYSRQHRNEYVSRFYPRVKAALVERGYDLVDMIF